MAKDLPDIPPLPKFIPVAVIATVVVVLTVIVMIIVINANAPDTPAADGATASAVATSGGTPAAATIDAQALFMNGDAAAGAISCASCHALAAAGATGKVGPSLDQLAKDDKAAAISEMITKPNAEIVAGYQPNVMPQNYATTLSAAQITALAAYVDKTSTHA